MHGRTGKINYKSELYSTICCAARSFCVSCFTGAECRCLTFPGKCVFEKGHAGSPRDGISLPFYAGGALVKGCFRESVCCPVVAGPACRSIWQFVLVLV